MGHPNGVDTLLALVLAHRRSSPDLPLGPITVLLSLLSRPCQPSSFLVSWSLLFAAAGKAFLGTLSGFLGGS